MHRNSIYPRFMIMVAVALISAACSNPSAVARASTLNLQPSSAPIIVGAYDFDLLGIVSGSKCVAWTMTRDNETRLIEIRGLDKFEADATANRAMHEAALEVIKANEADTLLVTSVIVESKEQETCATVRGRAVVIKKATREVATESRPQGETESRAQGETQPSDEKPPLP